MNPRVIYLIGEETEKLLPLVEDLDIVLVSIEGIDWERDLTPWEAPAAFKGQADFSGKADDFIRVMLEKIIPEAEKDLTVSDKNRSIAGYSLGGLFALYAALKTNEFSGAASMSGSLWYDGWIDFLEKEIGPDRHMKVYLSLGDKEERSRNPRMARVGDWTRKTSELLAEDGFEVFFEINEGNHFFEIPERIAKGVRWISEGK
ncbi:alpha/beta hydrolase [Youngiibacter multivorans]|uniref:Alpha/beta superfamily hydrolase n=1 Tax=Youngiibacter multivorans TaxID=937251 RepID=A0ABS4G433_9CLOT|nr:alpha/beta hydrolase-fold protein [Youngiibacter multivorans]MBP1919305.1 putative alpha/beta superfamily hydrolase [Youngiibacter multivorans]